MVQRERDRQVARPDAAHTPDSTFERQGPEPPENDSGPSPSVEEVNRGAEEGSPVRNVDPDEQID